MTVRWLLAAFHLLALGIGLGAVFARAYQLQRASDAKQLRGIFLADSLWGLAALLWVATGLLRVFGSFEKGSAYYLHSSSFWTKMAFFVLVLALEIWPMTTLIRWRLRSRAGTMPDLSAARGMARISYVQALLVVCMVFAATAMARGLNW